MTIHNQQGSRNVKGACHVVVNFNAELQLGLLCKSHVEAKPSIRSRFGPQLLMNFMCLRRGDEDTTTNTIYAILMCAKWLCNLMESSSRIPKPRIPLRQLSSLTEIEPSLIIRIPTCQFLETSSRSLSHTWSHGKRIKNKAVAYFRI